VKDILIGIFGVIFALVLVIAICFGVSALYRNYSVWSANKSGEAQLAEANQNRNIAVLEAKARMESSHYAAEAEVIRAKGVAQANDIIMGRLGGPQNYLAYLQIEAMKDTKGQVIYVPTETGLPITEATRNSH
jgi:hypothetical protein